MIDNILNPIRLNKIIKLDWYELWINKSNYISNYYNNIKGKYKIIDESIDYYMAILDSAIYYLKNYTNYYDYSYVQHRIIIDNEFEIKEDVKERDFAEYLKYLFYKKCDINYVYKLIDNNMFNYDLVVARLLFPSYYLYYLERVINNKDLDKLEEIINRVNEHEDYLKNIVNRINEKRTKKIVLPF